MTQNSGILLFAPWVNTIPIYTANCFFSGVSALRFLDRNTVVFASGCYYYASLEQATDNVICFHFSAGWCGLVTIRSVKWKSTDSRHSPMDWEHSTIKLARKNTSKSNSQQKHSIESPRNRPTKQTTLSKRCILASHYDPFFLIYLEQRRQGLA